MVTWASVRGGGSQTSGGDARAPTDPSPLAPRGGRRSLYRPETCWTKSKIIDRPENAEIFLWPQLTGKGCGDRRECLSVHCYHCEAEQRANLFNQKRSNKYIIYCYSARQDMVDSAL